MELNSPDWYLEAIIDKDDGLILDALPAAPNSCNLFLTTSFIASFDKAKYFRGSNSDGFSKKYFLIEAVDASLKSVSTLTFLTPFLIPSFISLTGTPYVSLICPPYLFI